MKLPQVETLIITAWDWVSSLLTHKFFLTLPFAQWKASIPRQVMPTNYPSFPIRFMQQQFHTLCDSSTTLVVIEISPFSHPLCCHLSVWRLLPGTHTESNNWTTAGPQHSILSFILMASLMPSRVTLSVFTSYPFLSTSATLLYGYASDLPGLVRVWNLELQNKHCDRNFLSFYISLSFTPT